MSEIAKPLAEWAATIIEMIGVGLLLLLTPYVLTRAAIQLYKRVDREDVYQWTRSQMARAILLGLEFLVAADIVHTVAVDLSFQTVGVLALVVVVRTFLSFTIELEVSGRWPWQRASPERSQIG